MEDMNDKTKKLLRELSDHVVATGYRDDNGCYNYRVEGLELTSKQVVDLDEILRLDDISAAGKKGAESGTLSEMWNYYKNIELDLHAVWITCEEPENTPIMFCRITGLDTIDKEKSGGDYCIIFDTLDGPKIWTFGEKERRNEVYTKVYNCINPEVF